MSDTALPTNDVAESERRVDDQIRKQFSVVDGGLTAIGVIVAEACVCGTYPPDALKAATRAFELRGKTGKSDNVQISKLANFPAVAVAWNRKGIELVKSLVAKSRSTPRQYDVLVHVLGRLKRRKERPSVADALVMLNEAQQAKPKKVREVAKTATRKAAEPAVAKSATSASADHDPVRTLDARLDNSATPANVRKAWALVKSHLTAAVSDAGEAE